MSRTALKQKRRARRRENEKRRSRERRARETRYQRDCAEALANALFG